MAGFQNFSYTQPGECVIGKVIGSGLHGNIRLAMNRTTGQLFVAKSATTQSAVQSLENEANILVSLDLPYVVRFLGKNESQDSLNVEGSLSIFLEYMPAGSLADLVETFGGAIDEEVIRLHTREILQGLKYIHQQKIVHCDLKCKNVLLGSCGSIKLADFGCAKRINRTKNSKNESGFWQDIGGTPLWMAPEVLRKERLDFSSDIWSLGCTVLEMATGRTPWFGQVSNPVAAVLKIACSDELPSFPAHFSEEGLDFLSKCLERDPERRWTAEDLLDHPFISGESLKEFGPSLAAPYEDEFRGRNQSFIRHCEEWKSVQKRKQAVETDFGSSENWITVRYCFTINSR